MTGFLFKLLIIIAIVGGIGSFLYFRFFGSGQTIGNLSNLFTGLKQVDMASVSGQLSSRLDSLITHTDRSPMVMGIDITNKSLGAMVDTLMSLPPEDLELIRQLVCQPASPSAK